MREKKIRVGNILLGLLTGTLISTFLMALTNLLLFYLQYRHPDTTYGWIKVLCGVIGSVTFLMVMKLFLAREKNQLSMYFLFSVVAAMAFTVIILSILLNMTQPIIMNEDFQELLWLDNGFYVVTNVVYVFILLLVFSFITAFWLLVNRKVRYIRYISEEVKQIELDGFGRTMEVRGNDELSELSTAINTMSIELKEKIEQENRLVREKNELITNVSHDLRTPLTSVIGYVSLLKQNKFENKEQCMEYIEVVDRRLRGLNVMINELFEYTKMNGTDVKLDFVNVDIIAILEHLTYEYSILYEKEGLTLETQIDPEHCELKVDVEKIMRVLQNLFENARKYALKRSEIYFHVYEQEKELVLELQNETDQTHPEDMEQLFERFYKGDTARSEADSSGLGLSIVKRIVELHDGKISAMRKGSSIIFQIRLKRS